jgi:hypothetical protein
VPFHEAQTRGEAPSPGICAKSAQIPTSPRERGEVKPPRPSLMLAPPMGAALVAALRAAAPAVRAGTRPAPTQCTSFNFDDAHD